MESRVLVELLWKLRQMRAREHWIRKHLFAHQAEALHSLREYAYAHSPFYQQFHQGLCAAPLHELPVLTKALIAPPLVGAGLCGSKT